MKPGVSTLNPYAASYIPLSKRDGADKIDVPGVAVWYGSTEHTGPSKRHYNAASSIPDAFIPKSQSAHGYYGSSSQETNHIAQKQTMDEEDDMDLEYLRISFPSISAESLHDVYVANRGDLDASIDMLNQLEFGTIETPENLPDSLDIGDVSELVASSESSSVKLKNVVGEASTSSSGSSTSDSVTVT